MVITSLPCALLATERGKWLTTFIQTVGVFCLFAFISVSMSVSTHLKKDRNTVTFSGGIYRMNCIRYGLTLPGKLSKQPSFHWALQRSNAVMIVLK